MTALCFHTLRWQLQSEERQAKNTNRNRNWS